MVAEMHGIEESVVKWAAMCKNVGRVAMRKWKGQRGVGMVRGGQRGGEMVFEGAVSSRNGAILENRNV